MTRYPSRLGDTFRIYYADPVRWRSQPLRWSSNLGMDTSWIAPAIEAGGQVTSSIITVASEAERQKAEAKKRRKKKKKNAAKPRSSSDTTATRKSQEPEDDDVEETDTKKPIPWVPILVAGAAVLGVGVVLLRQNKKAGVKP